MSGIINDVDSLRAFRQRLDETAETLQKQLQKTEQAIEDVAKPGMILNFWSLKKNLMRIKKKLNPSVKR